MRKIVMLAAALITVIAIFSVILAVFLNSAPPKFRVIRIQADGSLDPAAVPIYRNGDVYTFAGDVYASIVVDRDNVVIDGAGYVLYGPYNGTRTDSFVIGEGPDQEVSSVPWTIGVDLANRDRYNLTIKNLNIQNFSIGMYLWTSNNVVIGNAVTNNIVGILLSGDSNTIIENFIANNEDGVFFGVNTPGNEPLNITLTNNSFIDNIVQFSGCFCEDFNTEEEIHTWDDGSRGNYWSDYNGTDSNGDGIGDTPYIIDYLNQDRFPLVATIANPPSADPKFPAAFVLATVLSVFVLSACLIFYFRKRNR